MVRYKHKDKFWRVWKNYSNFWVSAILVGADKNKGKEGNQKREQKKEQQQATRGQFATWLRATATLRTVIFNVSVSVYWQCDARRFKKRVQTSFLENELITLLLLKDDFTQRFEEKWVAHEECENQIRSSWTQSHPIGSPMFCLFERLKKC